jgi:hypothetical protein
MVANSLRFCSMFVPDGSRVKESGIQCVAGRRGMIPRDACMCMQVHVCAYVGVCVRVRARGVIFVPHCVINLKHRPRGSGVPYLSTIW